jgi:hypothetical protein
MTLDIDSFLKSITTIQVEIKRLEGSISRLDEAINKVGRKNVTAKIDVSTTAADAKVAKLAAKLDTLRDKTVSVDTINNTKNNVTNSSSGSKGGSGDNAFKMWPALIGGGAFAAPQILGGAAAAIAGAAGVAVVGVTALASAFMGLKSAYSQTSTAATALTTAQIAASHATSNSALGKALEQEQKALAGMTPEMNNSVGALQQMKAAWASLGGTDYTVTLTHGLITVTELLNKFAPVTQSARSGVNDFIGSLNSRINTGGFDTFFNYMKSNAGGFINQWGNIITNFIQGIGNMAAAVDPLTKMVSGGFQSMSEKFLAFSQNIQSNNGFKSFIQYGLDNGPKLYGVLRQIVVDVVDLVKSFAPLGGGVLGQLKMLLDLLDFLSKIPGFSAIAALIALFVGIKGPLSQVTGLMKNFSTVAEEAGNTASGAGGKLGLLGRLATGTSEGWNKFSTQVGVATWSMTGSNKAGEKAMSIMGGLGKVLGNLGGYMPLIGVGLGIVGDMYSSIAQKQSDATASTLKWMQAQDQGGQSAADGTKHISDLKSQIADLTAKQNAYNAAAAGGGARGGDGGISSHLADLKSQLGDATKSYNDQRAAMTEYQRKQEDVTKAQNNLDLVLQTYPATSAQAKAATDSLTAAQAAQADWTSKLTQASMSYTDKMMQGNNAALSAASAQLGLASAENSTATALSNYDKVMANGKSTQIERNAAEISLAQSMLSAASAADANSRAQNALLPASQQNLLASRASYDELVKLADQMGDKTPAAIRKAIDAQSANMASAINSSNAFQKLGKSVETVPNSKDIVIHAPTKDAEATLTALGLHVTHLPNGDIQVTADTNAANNIIEAYMNQRRTIVLSVNLDNNGVSAQAYAIGTAARNALYGGLGTNVPSAPGRQTRATGGYIYGPGTGTSDSIPARLSNGEYVITADKVAKFGRSYFDSINYGKVPGYANGGMIGGMRGSGSADQALQPNNRGGDGPLVHIANINMNSGQGVTELTHELSWALVHGLPSMAGSN